MDKTIKEYHEKQRIKQNLKERYRLTKHLHQDKQPIEIVERTITNYNNANWPYCISRDYALYLINS